MPNQESLLKSDRNRFLQIDSRQSARDAFVLLASPEVNGQSWWHLVVLKSDGSWAAVRFSDLYEAVGQDSRLLDAPLEWIEALHPLRTVEQGSVGSREALQMARSSPGRMLGVTENDVLAGIIFEGGMRGGPQPSQQELQQLAASSQEGQREHRYTDISCPRRVSRQSDRFSLVVRLLLQPSRLSAAHLEMEAEGGRALQVRLQAPGFEVLGESSQQIDLEPHKDSPPAAFDLRPLEIGAQRLSLDFYQGGNPLGTVDVPVDVLEEPVAEVSVDLPRQKLPAAPQAASPDLILRIVWDKVQDRLHFSLMREGGIDWREFPAVPLRQAPSNYAQDLFGDLTRWSEASLLESGGGIANSQGLSAQQIDRRLRALGQNLWRSGLPEELKRLYAKERDAWKDRTIMIFSDEPYIPWELV